MRLAALEAGGRDRITAAERTAAERIEARLSALEAASRRGAEIAAAVRTSFPPEGGPAAAVGPGADRIASAPPEGATPPPPPDITVDATPGVSPPPEEGAPPPPPPPASVPPILPPPAARPGLEELFGTRGVVWAGGLALALGGIFLVRFSIEQGWIGPGVRIALGALLGAALVSVGEWLRRRENLAGLAGLPTAHIPSILAAAGTTVCYATVFAAYSLYDFIGPAAAFVLLGATALATLGAALLHGPALAALGLVGAEVTPLLVSTHTPNYWALYIYLSVVTAAAFAMARVRLWRWLAVTAVAFGLFWALPGIADAETGTIAPHVFHAVAGFGLAALLIVAGLFFGPEAAAGRVDALSSGSVMT